MVSSVIFSRPDYSRIRYSGNSMVSGGPVEMLLRAIAPNCTQLILKCVVGKLTMTGWQCCKEMFDPNPYFTKSGKHFLFQIIQEIDAKIRLSSYTTEILFS